MLSVNGRDGVSNRRYRDASSSADLYRQYSRILTADISWLVSLRLLETVGMMAAVRLSPIIAIASWHCAV